MLLCRLDYHSVLPVVLFGVEYVVDVVSWSSTVVMLPRLGPVNSNQPPR